MRLCIGLLWATLAIAQNMGRVEGRVLSTTGEPVRKAVVRLQTTMDGETGGYAEVSGTDGSFVFANVRPGQYTVIGEKAAFGPMRPSKRITVTAGQGQTGVEVRLPALAVIAGRVVDEDGDPLVAVRVSVMRYRWQGANRLVQRGAGAQTDDRGEFRIPNLEPGRYFLLVEDQMSSMRSALAIGNYEGSAARRVSMPTYYPNEIDIARALPIEAKSGMETAGIVVRMRRGENYTVRGTAIHGVTGEPIGGTIMATLRDNPSQTRSNTGIRNAGEGFAIRGLIPGDYVLTLNVADPADRQRQMQGQVEIAVTGDVDGIVLRVFPGYDIPGRITVENGDFAALAQAPVPNPYVGTPVRVPQRGAVSIIRTGSPVGGGFSSQIGADGTFTWKNVTAGKYFLNMAPYQGAYVKSVRAGGAEWVNSALDLSNGAPGQIEIVLATDAAVLTPATLPPNETAQLRTLAAWPLQPRLADELAGVRVSNVTAPNPRLTNLPPGEYYFALFDDVDPNLTQAYGFLAQFNELAAKVTLEPGANVSVEPKLIPKAAVEAALP